MGVLRKGAVALAVVLVVGGCSDGGDDSLSPTTTSEATTTTVPAPKPLRVLTLNVLHGLFCEKETDSCHAPDRAEMVARGIEAAKCPELVGFQEIGPRQAEVVPPAMKRVCDGRYELAWQAANSPDRAMVFTTLPIRDRGYLDLAAFPWEAYWVRVAAPFGPVDFLTTHFASSSNNPTCKGDVCPPVCPDGIDANECNAREVVAALNEQRAGAVLQLASGDFNAEPGSTTLAQFEDAGYVDAWLKAGNKECDPATGRGCTAGRDRPENALDGLDVPGGRYGDRIDYVVARPSDRCTIGSTAEPFAAEPAAVPVRGLYWPSDHAGVVAEITCG
jgi:endonuclease/exonuclease/phosphatase family metal-dependent hydrolase